MKNLGRWISGTLCAWAIAMISLPTDRAGAQGFDVAQIVQADIMPGWQEPDGTRIAALRLRLAPGWHTYWRIPGDAGIAPRFDWGRSQNVNRVQPIWPRPSQYVQGGLRSFVYHDQLILPLVLHPQRADRPVALFGTLTVGVCNEVCIPVDLTVEQALRGAGALDRAIQASLRDATRPAARAGMGRVTCRLEPAERGATLTLRATLPDQGRQEFIAIEMPGTRLWISTAETWREGGDLVARAHVRAPRGQSVGIDRQGLAYTVLSDRAMITGQGCVGG